MDFKTAIYTCLRPKYANFSDRASISEFWWFVLFYITSIIGIGSIGLLIAVSLDSMGLYGSAYHVFVIAPIILWVLFLIIPIIAVNVRRFHDIDMTGWWFLLFYLLQCIPLINLIAFVVNIVLFCKPGSEGPNRFGNSPFAIDDYQETFK
ncbi:DUF805 domain-containing protein [Bartonella sp. HY329]|uniref:DUF805 domain-containing protein n=1 Tax=unclassified Bartonella TaxID=2645622 RepID=UPI0021CA77EE|nr:MULTISPECIES: DUF805 domain-containing protein [unclassified Bartonella]UXM94555.1 DUF805 domain-containing protein [Bartonella sp. HY329]UXN08879.1 DUF805 domain-containing protein [Bartonella sp. HY328]